MLGGWKESVIRALFFDVGGTLLQPAEPIGATYASLAVAYGWKAGSEAVQRGFRAAWKKRREEGVGSDKTLGKKGWARIVEESLKQAEMPEDFPFEVYFEEVFEYFARPEAWRDFSETGASNRRNREKRATRGGAFKLGSSFASCVGGVRVGQVFGPDFAFGRVRGGEACPCTFSEGPRGGGGERGGVRLSGGRSDQRSGGSGGGWLEVCFGGKAPEGADGGIRRAGALIFGVL